MNGVTRRQVLKSLAAGPVLAAAGGSALAAEAVALTAVRRSIEVKGRAASVFGLDAPGGHGLAFRLGENFRVRLTNDTGVDTLIHWHGLTPPPEQDGVPGLSQPALRPGQSYDYDFLNTRSGTHWMHSHVGFQEQQLLAAPLIIRELDQPLWDEQEHVVMLHDFTFRDPQEILEDLQKGGGGHARHGVADADMSKMDMTGMTGMTGMLNDVSFDAYLANDRTLDDPEVLRAEAGAQIRLRIINAAAASNMWIDLGGLEGQLIAVDGAAVVPLKGSLFPLAIAQRADIRLKLPAGAGAYPVLFRPEGLGVRTGMVIATADANVPRVPETGDVAPPLDLAFEARLRAVAQLPQEPVTRSEMLMLTGGGADYQWGFNGKPSMHDSLMRVRSGERIAVMLHNMTMMAHPMHLHGHYFKVVALNGQRIDGAIRDTVLVPPMQNVTIMFDANNPGVWAFHCHHLYHMNSGMMGTLNYLSAA
jgi:FtsP/CotA-like multicopper oxidase with cupredoxin domain